jgi:Uma2 family endonuclease
MGIPEPRKYISEEAYFAYEASIEGKAEYHDGEIFDMAGGTKMHGVITSNLSAEIVFGLKGKSCSVFSSDVKIKIEATKSYVYPDISVECSEPDDEAIDSSIVFQPILVVEVLSDSTATYDMGAKFFRYQRISSLMEYVLVDQFSPTINVITRNEDGNWEIKTSNGLNEIIELQSIAMRIPLAAIYNRVIFPQNKRSLI